MFWKKKKKETITFAEPQVYIPPQCSHKWRDFKWYMTAEYNDGYDTYSIKIIEPYVCIWCGERKDVVLHSITRQGKYQRFAETLKELKQMYGDNIQPRAIIEDQIADQQLVDREYLKIVDNIFPNN